MTDKRRIILTLGAVLFVFAFATGCVSPKRLFNLTPLGNSTSRNTVNLWPICYANENGTSVLWPFFDTDAKGFALRPLVFNEGKEWGVLWPVSDFDQNYFRLLTMVIAKDKGGVIPLFWIGKDDFWQVLLAYRATKEEWGVFPLFCKGKDFNYLLPLYIYNRKKNLFTPIGYFSPTFNCVTLAWWNRDNGYWGLFPVCFMGQDAHHFLLWWKTPNSTGLFPFYIRVRDFTAAGPIWWDKNAWGIFPLFSCSSTQNKTKIGLLSHIVGGCEWGTSARSLESTRAAEASPRPYYSVDWLCYFGRYEKRIFDNNNVQHKFRMWPLFDHANTTQGISMKEAPGTFKHNALLGALWNYRSNPSRAWLGEQANDCTKLSLLIRTAKATIVYRNALTQDTCLELDEKRQSINEMCQKLALPPIERICNESLETLEKELECKYPKSNIQNRSFGMLLDLLDYRKNDRGTTFSLIWGTLFKRKTSPMKNETSVLWRGFRQVTTPTQSSCEVFPFISYYNNQEEQTTVSAFAWRFFRRETSPDGNKL
ncbi:MAG: hypothetical protein IKS20_10825, partial [Victivallales bacterium]|nr:hypothetical protein [Victivallales bacterium]